MFCLRLAVLLTVPFICVCNAQITCSDALPNVCGAVFGNLPAPFELNVDPAFIYEVMVKVRYARAPIPIDGVDPTAPDGPPVSVFEDIQQYWVNEYDWASVQRHINWRFNQFTTTVDISNTTNYTDPVPLHFVHHKSPRKDAIPLLFVHGYPGSFLEVENILRPLTRPQNASAPAFHVVAPSIPGFGFSPAPKTAGFGPGEAAAAFNALMGQLGYDKYVMQAGDLGAIITQFQAVAFPDNVVSVLSNLWIVPPNSTDLERYQAGETSADETAYIQRIGAFGTSGSGYRFIQQFQPLTISYPLTDSPMGFLMWIYALMAAAVDPRVKQWEPKQVITWSMMYFIQGPYGAARMYKEFDRAGVFDGLEFSTLDYVEQPVGITQFPYDVWYREPLDWAQRIGNVKRRTVHVEGGHFPSVEVPDVLVADIRSWFGDEASGTGVFARE